MRKLFNTIDQTDISFRCLVAIVFFGASTIASASDYENDGFELLAFIGPGLSFESGTTTFGVNGDVVSESEANGSFTSFDGVLGARYWIDSDIFIGAEGDLSFALSGSDRSAAGEIDLKNSYAAMGIVGYGSEDEALFLRGGLQKPEFEVGGNSIQVDPQFAIGFGAELQNSWIEGGRFRAEFIRQNLAENDDQIGLDGSLIKVRISYGIKF